MEDSSIEAARSNRYAAAWEKQGMRLDAPSGISKRGEQLMAGKQAFQNIPLTMATKIK